VCPAEGAEKRRLFDVLAHPNVVESGFGAGAASQRLVLNLPLSFSRGAQHFF